jgi:hypothetical protein
MRIQKPTRDQLSAAQADPLQVLGLAVYERQRELNELHTAAGHALDTEHARVVAAIQAQTETISRARTAAMLVREAANGQPAETAAALRTAADLVDRALDGPTGGELVTL